MRIQRLSWAGIKLAAGATTLFVDAIATAGDWGLPAVPLAAATPRRHALVTHAHPDHYDPVALRGVLGDGGHVLCHRATAGELARRNLAVPGVALHEPVPLDWLSADLAVTAVPAADGWGFQANRRPIGLLAIGLEPTATAAIAAAARSEASMQHWAAGVAPALIECLANRLRHAGSCSRHDR